MSLALNTKHLSSFINEEEYKAIYPQVEAAHKTLEAKNGPGSDFLGWMYLPRDYDKEEFERIKAAAAKIREDSDVLVVAGIGGSYLGARAVIEAVKGMYHNELDNGLKIYFCGQDHPNGKSSFGHTVHTHRQHHRWRIGPTLGQSDEGHHDQSGRVRAGKTGEKQ